MGWSVGLRLVVAAVIPAAAFAAGPEPEIVVAIRYLQETGTSYSHLYLYREDGKLLRQLTTGDGPLESKPVFSPDGETIAFTRDVSEKVHEVWSIEPRGGNLRRLDPAPDWYVHAKDAPTFGHDDAPDSESVNTDTRVYPAPAGLGEVVVKPKGIKNKDDTADGFEVRWRAAAAGPAKELGSMDGILAFHATCKEESGLLSILSEGALRVMFLDTYLNSTDGSSTYAVDLVGKRLVRLSRNGNTVIPLPGEAAFLSWDYPRYVPFGSGKHTTNASFFEHWDTKLQTVRYADKDACVTYGASMYRPGMNPAVIIVSGGSSE